MIHTGVMWWESEVLAWSHDPGCRNPMSSGRACKCHTGAMCTTAIVSIRSINFIIRKTSKTPSAIPVISLGTCIQLDSSILERFQKCWEGSKIRQQDCPRHNMIH